MTCVEFLEESLQATILPHIPAMQKLTNKLTNKNQLRAKFLEESVQATLLPHRPAIQQLTNKLNNKNQRRANVTVVTCVMRSFFSLFFFSCRLLR